VAVEAVQVSQSLDNTVPLIEKKKTMVRVYLETKDDSMASVQVRLRVKNSQGTEVVLTAIEENVRVQIEGSVLSRRNKLDSTVNFIIPEAYTTAGSIEVTPEGLGVTLDCPGTIPGCATTLTFVSGPVLDITVLMTSVNLADGTTAGFGTKENTETVKINTTAKLLSIFPTSKINIEFETMSSDALPDGLRSADLLSDAKWKRFVNNIKTLSLFSEKLYYALIPEDTDLIYYDRNDNVQGLWGQADDTAPVACGRYSNQRKDGYHTTAHELGHVMDVDHTVSYVQGTGTEGYCGESGYADAEMYPTTHVEDGFPSRKGNTKRYTLGPLSAGERSEVWGWDSFNHDILDPREHFEVMSYCNSAHEGWMSDVSFAKVKTFLTGTFGVASVAPKKPTVGKTDGSTQTDDAASHGPTADRRKPPQMQAVESYQVYAIEITDTVNIVFKPSKAVVADPSSITNPGPGAYTLVLLDSAQQTLLSVSFEPDVSAVAAADELPVATTFIAVSGTIPAASAKVVYADPQSGSDLDLQSITGSANSPVVDVVYPNGGESLFGREVFSWTASDADNDPLTFDVYISYDSGASWDLLAVNTAATHFAVNTTDLGKRSR
jgi:hypothetical protein